MGQHRRRITLGVGQTLTIGGLTIVFVRDNSNGTVVLDVPSDNQQPPQIDHSRRRHKPLRQRDATTR